MKRARIGLPCLVVLLAAACVRTSVIRLGGSQPLPRTSPDDVQIYLSAREVTASYTRLALVTAEEWSGVPTYGEMVARMKARAAKLGANGLILQEMARRIELSGGQDEPVSLDSEKTLKGLAIYVSR